MTLTHTCYFSGIGGFSLAAKNLNIKTTQFVEIDPTAQASLAYNFPNIPIHADIRDYSPPPGIDLYSVGFPCTQTSGAGKRTGLSGESSGLWFEALRCIRAGQPRFIIIENPAGLVDRGLRAVLGGLRMAGYSWEDPTLLSAALLGAPHRRERLFIVAYANRLRWQSVPPSWSDQVRDLVQEVRARSAWPQFESTTDGVIARLPTGMARERVAVANGRKGRMKARILMGRTVVPACAEIPLRRVVELSKYVEVA